MVRVKICGITNREDAVAAVAAGADMLGFNFYAKSARYLEPETVRDLIKDLPPGIATVGVFVNSTRDEVGAIADRSGVGMLQFHGDERPEFCQGWHLPVIRAIRLRDQASVVEAAAYKVDFILADAFVSGEYGGTGRRVPVEWLAGLDREKMILAGGLTPENIGDVLRGLRPYAVDVASGVESAPGKKDHQRMRRFVANVHAA